MAKQSKIDFFAELSKRFGKPELLPDSYSLYKFKNSNVRIYIRYSRTYQDRQTTWYGLRNQDLKALEGFPSAICFIWDNQQEPLIIPFSEYEDVFHTIEPTSDGQYKAQVILVNGGTEFYINRVGRFNVEDHVGWQTLENLTQNSSEYVPDLSHSQVQTLLGAIGQSKDFDIWIPPLDRTKLDWNLTKPFQLRDSLPQSYERISTILEEIDVIWVQKGSNRVTAMFEVEHSTPIYSGLLRFNDFFLTTPDKQTRLSIVANNARRALFSRQLNRPTFQASGINEVCTFLEYINVYNWHHRVVGSSEKE
jgi:hypothetical protein